MRTARIVGLLTTAGLAWSLAAQAADSDRQPPTPPEPAKEQERAVKPPTDASMGAVERKPEPATDPGKKK